MFANTFEGMRYYIDIINFNEKLLEYVETSKSTLSHLNKLNSGLYRRIMTSDSFLTNSEEIKTDLEGSGLLDTQRADINYMPNLGKDTRHYGVVINVMDSTHAQQSNKDIINTIARTNSKGVWVIIIGMRLNSQSYKAFDRSKDRMISAGIQVLSSTPDGKTIIAGMKGQDGDPSVFGGATGSNDVETIGPPNGKTPNTNKLIPGEDVFIIKKGFYKANRPVDIRVEPYTAPSDYDPSLITFQFTPIGSVSQQNVERVLNDPEVRDFLRNLSDKRGDESWHLQKVKFPKG